MKFSFKDFFRKYGQFRSFLRIRLHLLKKFLTLIRLGILRVVLSGRGVPSPFIFQEELIQYQNNFIQLLKQTI